MVVPAMEAQGTAGSLIKRRVEANTTCFSFVLPRTTTPTSGSGEATGFAVRLRCNLTMYIRTGTGHGPEVTTRSFRCGAGGAGETASGLVVPGSGEAGVSDALRRALKSIPALRELGLTDAEWESLVPEDVVPRLADPAEQRRHAAAEVHLAVALRVRYDAARMLLTGCKKIADDQDDADAECSVCFGALRLRGEAVRLPGCAHAFHRRCIAQWFRRKPTCPLCRGDVVKHLDPEVQKQIAEFTDDAM